MLRAGHKPSHIALEGGTEAGVPMLRGSVLPSIHYHRQPEDRLTTGGSSGKCG